MPLNNFAPQQQVPQQQMQQPIAQPNTYQPVGMLWVKGYKAACDYPVARGASMALFDQDEERFYVKSVDLYSNQQTIRAFSYEEIPTDQFNGNVDMSKYVTIDKFNALMEELEELKAQRSKNNYNKPQSYKKKENDEQ